LSINANRQDSLSQDSPGIDASVDDMQRGALKECPVLVGLLDRVHP
jgi:hypothetical protein